MRVLFLSPDFVLPANRGLRVRVLSQLQLLSAIETIESITLLSLSTTAVPNELLRSLEQQLPKVQVSTPIIRDTYIRRSRRAFGYFLYRRLLRNEPYLIATHSIPKMRALIARHLRTQHYDVVYFGYLGMMAYFDLVKKMAPRAHLILEQHNLEWQIFQRLTANLTTPIRQLALLEAYALRYCERRALRQVDSVIAISEVDASHFRDMAGITPVVIPPFVEPAEPRTEVTQDLTVGYIGHLAWQPNVYGLDWFCGEVWPLVVARIPKARLMIAGPGLKERADGTIESPAAWQVPGITTVGFVKNLDELYKQTLVMIAPVIGGSGVRMKILETMSAGMPTVTTSDGAAGLAVETEKEVLIADNAEDYSDCVARLLLDADLRERIRQAGYAYLSSNHSLDVTKAQLERSLATVGPHE